MDSSPGTEELVLNTKSENYGFLVENISNLTINQTDNQSLEDEETHLQSKLPTAKTDGKIIYKRKNYVSWNDYFMATALLSAKRSKDPVTQVGACIVNDDQRIVAIGYNGFPRNCDDDVFPWCKRKKSGIGNDSDDGVDNGDDPLNDKRLYVVHAEANAILNSNAASLKGTTLYTTLFPCNECTKLIIQSGIQKIYFISDKYVGKPSFRASKRMLNAAGIQTERFIPMENRIILDFDEIIREDPTSPCRQKVE